MNYQLRTASLSDKIFIYNLKKSSIYKYVEEIWGWDEKKQKEFFEDDFIKMKEFDIISCDNIDIGFLQLSICERLINITEIHLIPEYQGKGIGTDIIKNIIDEGKQKNKVITLGCFKSNIKAKNLYLKLGFDLVQETQTHFVLEYKSK